MILALAIEVIIFYMRVLIVEVRVFGFEWSIARLRVCLKLALFIDSNK